MCVYVCVCDCVQAISNATEEIERKFSEMMRNENFDILEFYGRQKKLFEPARGPVDVTQSFAVLVKPAIADAALAAANSKKVLSLLCPFLPCPALLLLLVVRAVLLPLHRPTRTTPPPCPPSRPRPPPRPPSRRPCRLRRRTSTKTRFGRSCAGSTTAAIEPAGPLTCPGTQSWRQS